MAIHLCEVIIRETRQSVKFYEIEIENRPMVGFTDWDAMFDARRKAVAMFKKEMKHTPNLRKLIGDRDWCVDSIIIS